MLEENIALVLDILINKKKSMSVADIAEESELDSSLLNSAIKILKLLDLVSVQQDSKIQLNKIIKGINLAKAAQLGVDLLAFNFFEISKAEKKDCFRFGNKSRKNKNNRDTK